MEMNVVKKTQLMTAASELLISIGDTLGKVR